EDNKPEEKMEEEVKKPVEEEVKKPDEEKPKEEKKTEEVVKEPKPPEEIVLRVFMHCEGCARKVRRSLRGFEGVEDVQTDCKTHKVIVKGKNGDPLKVLERVQRKSNKQVELLTPIPKPPVEDEKKTTLFQVIITVVLKVHMHCEACAQEIQKRILRMKGVQTVEADLKSSQVMVKGVFEPPKLVEHVYKRTGKHAMIVHTEPEKKEEEKADMKDEKEEKGESEKKEGEEAKPADEEAKNQEAEAEAEAEETKVEVELKKNEFYYYPPKYHMEYAYPPQIFSDENPNACSVM
ncbi:hypothetical protein IFM89_031094, partial [Coptis chinensis]